MYTGYDKINFNIKNIQMRNRGLFFYIVVLLCAQFIIAQNGDINQYRRSSLYTIIIDDEGLMEGSKAEIIKKTFFETPLPEKLNDHNLHTLKN